MLYTCTLSATLGKPTIPVHAPTPYTLPSAYPRLRSPPRSTSRSPTSLRVRFLSFVLRHSRSSSLLLSHLSWASLERLLPPGRPLFPLRISLHSHAPPSISVMALFCPLTCLQPNSTLFESQFSRSPVNAPRSLGSLPTRSNRPDWKAQDYQALHSSLTPSLSFSSTR